MQDNLDELKRAAALKAAEQVKSGMIVGLGTGSTAKHVVDALGARWRDGTLRNFVGIPTSERTAQQARAFGLPLGDLRQYPSIDLAIDGADEVDPVGDLIKGLGGALLREKEVELRARKLVIVVDETKLVPKLGLKCPVPVEVVKQSWRQALVWLSHLGGEPKLRGGEATPYTTDNGNFIVDLRFEKGIPDKTGLAQKIESQLWVRAHGLFLGMVNEVIIAERRGVRSWVI
jgi:ribose 5-phosphate isomerase A